MRRTIAAATGLGLALGVVGGLAAVAAYAARHMSGPTPRRYLDDYTFTPFETQVEWEEVRFRSADGLELSGWWLPRSDSGRVVIGCTGHRGGKHDLLGIGSGLWRAGNTMLLFDFRGRGQSEQGLCSLAYHEVQDLLGAVAYARRRRPEARLGVVGYSMGAAVAILAAAQSNALEAVVADSSFASMRDVVGHRLRRRGIPPVPVAGLADLLTRCWYGYRFEDVRPVDVVGQIAPRPLLVIHGADDTMIPVSHARRLFEAAGAPKELWVVDQLEHCGGYFANRAAYVGRVAKFLERALGG